MRYALACPERHAAAAGEAAFAAGGNALDAALAAAAALAVSYPHNTGVGGDLFAVLRSPGGRCVSVNASGPAPRAADAGALRRRGPRMPVRGPDTVTVPGAVRGWERLHALGAALPWARAFDAARQLARDGVPVSRSLAEASDELDGAEPFAGLRAGDTLRQPALAATLAAIADDGADALYAGAVGRRLVAGLCARGAGLTEDDLASFAPETTEPLIAGFRGLTLHTSPPNSSGVLLLQALAAFERAGGDTGSLAHLLRQGAAQRERELADPRFAPFDRATWLGDDRLGELARDRAPAVTGAHPTGDTVAVVTADGEGRAVSLIQSLCGSFGSYVLEPETGILMQNRGAFFSLVPGHPNELAPGKRPSHTLMPLIAERDGAFAGALGTMGGKAHAQIHAQILLALLGGATAQDAVAAPRWVTGGLDPGESDLAARAERGLDPETRAALTGAGFSVTDVPWPDENLGHAQAIWASNGGFDAGSDPRADGAALTG